MKFNKITDKRPEALHDHHMPKSYDISLKAYGGGAASYTHLTLPPIYSV